MRRQTLIVAKREFLERVRNKWFVIVTVLGPLGMLAAIALVLYLTIQSAQEGFHVQLLDHSGRDIGSQMNIDMDARGVAIKLESVPQDTPIETLEKRIRDEVIDGYLVLPSDVLTGGEIVYYGDNASSPMVKRGLSSMIDFAVFRTRGADLGLDDLEMATLFSGVNFEAKQTTGTGKATSGDASFFVGYLVMFILFMSIVLYAVAVLRSVIQEKTSRVVEVIISSIKPMPLMLGKVIGVGCVGLLQLAVWGLIAILLLNFREELFSLFGFSNVGDFDVPTLGIDDMAVIVIYFALGFFFYAAIYAAIGAMVNSEQEAQQAQVPVMLLLVAPMACVQIVAGDPRGTVAEVLTQLPFAAPFLMPMRYFMDAVSVGEMVLSMTILLASLVVTVFVAAKVYRVGILSYGKKPTMRELWRWIRA
jgi:ABC-2 type transport system permease protein